MSIVDNKQDQKNLFYSGRILASLQQHVRDFLKPGLPASAVEEFARNFAKKHEASLPTFGYQGYKFGTCVSINQEVVHGLPLADKMIPENGLVTVDIMLKYKGMITDSARTWVIGKVDDSAMKLVEGTREAMWAAVNQVRSGVRVGDLENAMQIVAEKHNLGNVTALGGHGVGYDIHDDPMILSAGKPGKGSKIFENMVFTIEPMFTLGTSQVNFDQTKEDGWTVTTQDGSWSAHEEHTILVTKNGFEIITQISPEEILRA